MSGLFGAFANPLPPPPPPPPPSPRDEEARLAAEQMRRAGQSRGRQTTVLTSRMQAPAQGYAPPRRTVVGGS